MLQGLLWWWRIDRPTHYARQILSLHLLHCSTSGSSRLSSKQIICLAALSTSVRYRTPNDISLLIALCRTKQAETDGRFDEAWRSSHDVSGEPQHQMPWHCFNVPRQCRRNGMTWRKKWRNRRSDRRCGNAPIAWAIQSKTVLVRIRRKSADWVSPPLLRGIADLTITEANGLLYDVEVRLISTKSEV